MSDMKHISKKDFDAFQRDIMKSDEKVIFLEHISSCDYCSDQFAAMMSEIMVEAPKDMKANILKATKRPDVQIAKKARETSKQMQLFMYSLKVGTATVLALLLLMFTMNSMEFMNAARLPASAKMEVISNPESTIKLNKTIRNQLDAFTNTISDFSNNIMNMEDTNND